jgi:GT2 family glycosyltransferase
VVIVTYNSAQDVPRAIEALAGERVVVVDNGSSDDTVEVAESMGVPVVRESNRGFGAGCNAGATALPDVDHVLFLNPDAVLSHEALRKLERYAHDHPRAGLIGPRMTSHGKPAHSAGQLGTAWSELRFLLPHPAHRLAKDRRLPPAYNRSGRVGVIEGACMLVDAPAFRAVKGFDESYFLFFEEHDLARRLAQHGYEVHLCAEATAEHAVGGSRQPLHMGGRAHYYESAIRYIRRWRGRLPAAFVTSVAWLWWTVGVPLKRVNRADASALKSGLLAGWRS